MPMRKVFNLNILTYRDRTVQRCYSFFKPSKDVGIREETESFDPEKPLKFSTSPAAHFNIRNIRLEPDPIADSPWYKPVIIFGTLMISVTYMIYARHRTDIDDELEMPLGKRVLLIKEQFVLKEKNDALRNGLSVQKFDSELEEIQRLRKKYKYEDD